MQLLNHNLFIYFIIYYIDTEDQKYLTTKSQTGNIHPY